jgi:hypothetical protein
VACAIYTKSMGYLLRSKSSKLSCVIGHGGYFALLSLFGRSFTEARLAPGFMVQVYTNWYRGWNNKYVQPYNCSKHNVCTTSIDKNAVVRSSMSERKVPFFFNFDTSKTERARVFPHTTFKARWHRQGATLSVSGTRQRRLQLC